MSTMTNIDWSLTHTYTHAPENTNVLRVPASDLSGVVSTSLRRIKAEDTGFRRHTYGVHDVGSAGKNLIKKLKLSYLFVCL